MKEARAEMATVRRLNPAFSLEDCEYNRFNEYQPADKKRFIDALKKPFKILKEGLTHFSDG